MSVDAAIVLRGWRVVDPRTRGQGFADILIVGDTIAEVGPPGMPAPAEARQMDASDRAIMPGFVNGHIHGHGTLAKGLVEDRWPLELFLNALPGLSGSRTLEDKRSEEHTSELQSLMRISYAVFCLKKKNTTPQQEFK